MQAYLRYGQNGKNFSSPQKTTTLKNLFIGALLLIANVAFAQTDIVLSRGLEKRSNAGVITFTSFTDSCIVEGKKIDIRWKKEKAKKYNSIKLYYSYGGNHMNELMPNYMPDSGHYVWEVPPLSKYMAKRPIKIKVVLCAYEHPGDYSIEISRTLTVLKK